MRGLGLGITAIWLALASSAPAAPPLEVYGQLPYIPEVEISPDGAHLAIMIGEGAKRFVQIIDIATNKLLTAVPLEQTKVRRLMWAGPDHLLIIYSTTNRVIGMGGYRGEWTQCTDYDLKQHKFSPLMTPQQVTFNVLAGTPSYRRVNGKDMVYMVAPFVGEEGLLALYERDMNNHGVHRIDIGNENTDDWMVDDNGDANVRESYEGHSGRWTLEVRLHGRWVKALTQVALLDPPQLKGLSRDGRSVLVDMGENDQRIIKSVSLDDAKVSTSDILATDGLIHDPRAHALIGVIKPLDDRYGYQFFDPQDQAIWDELDKAFSKDVLSLASWSDDRKRIVLKVEGADLGVGYFYLDLASGHSQWLADEYRGLGHSDVAPVTFIHYAAADGLSIPAYLTLPVGRPTKGLPLVVLVHGGPQARDDPGFDWISQAFASRGYAVLQPEYRGSSGFGADFLQAGYGQWGKKMQTDVSDGVRALVKQGTVDPARVCIAGWSYGGYAALAGAVFDPGAYRCAVDMAGPADLRLMLDEAVEDQNGYTDNLEVRYWDRFMGVKKPNDRNLDDISPARHADKAAVPILIVHGVDDTVVRYEQSQRMVDALKRGGKPYEFVTLKGEDHWGSRSETRLQLLQAWIKFLEAHNPPDPAPGVAKVALGVKP